MTVSRETVGTFRNSVDNWAFFGVHDGRLNRVPGEPGMGRKGNVLFASLAGARERDDPIPRSSDHVRSLVISGRHIEAIGKTATFALSNIDFLDDEIIVSALVDIGDGQPPVALTRCLQEDEADTALAVVADPFDTDEEQRALLDLARFDRVMSLGEAVVVSQLPAQPSVNS